MAENGLIDPDGERQLQTYASRVVDRTDALAVVLFGSRARDEAQWDSDFDVCIVLPDEATPETGGVGVMRPLAAGLRIPLDLKPVRYSSLMSCRDKPWTLEYEILRDGKVLAGSLGTRNVP